MLRLLRTTVLAVLTAAGLCSGTALFAPAATPLTPAPCSAATWSHHAALVVEHGDGQAVRVCIGFDSDSISAAQILQASGIEYATVSYGSLGDAVCQIDHEPQTYPASCWTSSSDYWTLFSAADGGGWHPAAQGIDSTTVSDAGAVGFRYEPQNGPMLAPASAAGTCTFATAAAQSAAPNLGNGGPGATTAPRQSAAAPPSDGASPGSVVPASSTPGVASVAAAPSLQTAAAGGLNGGLLAAVVVAGALAGLLATQLVLSRRR